MITFVVKKTTDLTEDEIKQSLQLNNDVFNEDCKLNAFLKRNKMNPFGYSYHSLMVVDNNIVGYNTGVPYYYWINGEKVKAICNIDTMISPKHRGIENFYELITSSFKCYKEEGFSFVLGYPNDNSYPIFKGTRLMKDIGKMNTYCLPIRIGAIKPSLKLFNWASKLFCRCFVAYNVLLSSDVICKFEIEKDGESFNQYRYKQFDTNYQFATFKRGNAVYAIKEYKGVRTAFIIDVTPKSAKLFADVVRYIIKKHQAEFDIILYSGYLPFSNMGLFKLPRKFEPKNFNFTGMIFDKKISKDLFYNISSWDTNLSNYDLI